MHVSAFATRKHIYSTVCGLIHIQELKTITRMWNEQDKLFILSKENENNRTVFILHSLKKIMNNTFI